MIDLSLSKRSERIDGTPSSGEKDERYQDERYPIHPPKQLEIIELKLKIIELKMPARRFV